VFGAAVLSGQIVSLERVRVARLTDEIAAQLASNANSVTRLTNDLNVGEWRRAARLAGRRLGIQVRTGVSRTGDKVWAVEGP
jgi:hypothetical protein